MRRRASCAWSPRAARSSFRGNVFWSHQNDALDANTWTSNRAGLEKSPHNYNAYGFTLGGPIYIPGSVQHQQAELFFFWGEEWQRDPHRRRTDAPSCRRARDAQRRLQRARCRDPSSGTAVDRRQAASRATSSRAIASARRVGRCSTRIPLPTPGFQQGANNWIGNPSVFNNQRKDSIKIDWVPVVRSSCRGPAHVGAERLERSRADGRVLDDLGLPGPHDGGHADQHAVALAHQRVLVLVGLDAVRRNTSVSGTATTARAVPARAVSDARSRVGINYPYLFPGTKLDPDKIPNLAMQGFTAINNAAYPGSWNDFVFLWADNVTKITGNHAFKAGASASSDRA